MSEAQKKLTQALERLIATEDGKRVMTWVLEECGVWQDAFTGDDAATNYRLGLRSAGLRVMKRLDDINPRLLPQMMLDMADIRLLDQATAEAQPKDNDDDLD